MNAVKPRHISPNKLQLGHLRSGRVIIRNTQMCKDVGIQINTLLRKKIYLRGVVGPPELGKSYALLHNYLILRNDPSLRILFISNAAKPLEYTF